ncbi:MAG: alpha-2-macroglobulin, partial [Prevotellaceae bacterium]|nr:alpha-2-macroglobulin [Prevotellaceae bacterium]
MKKVLFTLTLLLVPAMIMAESFSTLWKKVTEARQKDLPKTEISLLNNIIAKATTEDNYGHLIKAQLEKYHACRLFNDEQVASTIEEIKQKEAETQSKALQAVYNCALGLIYQDLSQSNIDPDKLSRPYFQKAMANPDELARHKTTELQPAFTLGLDSRIFNNDLLHVIGMYARDYSTLSKYYNAHSNRPAACIMALKALQETRDEDTKVARKSRYLHSLDSLIEVYRDLPEAGELAVEHYNFISESTDTPAESLVNYINYALNQWGKWPRMNVLRNALLGLLQPEFNISIGDRMLLPDVERQIRINLIRNINELTIKVYKVNIGGDTKLEASSKKDYAQLRRYIQPVPVQTITRRYLGQPSWKENTDSVRLKGMPIGVYLIEVSSNNKSIEPQRELLRVSNLYVIHEKIDKETLRLVTVN